MPPVKQAVVHAEHIVIRWTAACALAVAGLSGAWWGGSQWGEWQGDREQLRIHQAGFDEVRRAIVELKELCGGASRTAEDTVETLKRHAAQLDEHAKKIQNLEAARRVGGESRIDGPDVGSEEIAGVKSPNEGTQDGP